MNIVHIHEKKGSFKRVDNFEMAIQNLQNVIRHASALCNDLTTRRLIRVDHCEEYMRHLHIVNEQLRDIRRKLLIPVIVANIPDDPLKVHITMVDIMELAKPTPLRMNTFRMYLQGTLDATQADNYTKDGVSYYKTIAALQEHIDIPKCGDYLIEKLGCGRDQSCYTSLTSILMAQVYKCTQIYKHLEQSCTEKLNRRDKEQIKNFIRGL